MEMFDIFSRANIVGKGKIVFSSDRDKQYYLAHITECKKELKVLKKLRIKNKMWERNLKGTKKLKKNLNKTHKSFSRSVKVESVEKPGPSVFKRRRHNHKDVEKDNKDLEFVKKEAAKKAIEKEESQKIGEKEK